MNEILHALRREDAEAVERARAAVPKVPTPMTAEAYDRMIERTLHPRDVTYADAEVAGVRGVWCRPSDARSGAAVLYLHGGGYRLGSARGYRFFAGQIAERVAAPVFVAEYRLTAEARFPAAVDDARAAFDALALDNEAFAVVGDSAGGGLALALLAEGRPRPARACVAFSPWTDLALTGESIATRAHEDYSLRGAVLATAAAAYLGESDPRDPLASPLYADLTRLPPTQVHVGTAEILLDDAIRFARRGDVELHVWEGMPHVFPQASDVFVAAREALDLTATFLRAALRRG